MRIYVASSWRNDRQQEVVRALREDGHDTYDFREPRPGERGFSWHQLDSRLPPVPDPELKLSASHIRELLGHPHAADGYGWDITALRYCDACVLVLPCGRSAHLEAGFAVGEGKPTIVLLADGEPELMWRMADQLCTTLEEARAVLRRWAKLPNAYGFVPNNAPPATP